MAQSDALVSDIRALLAWEKSLVGWGPTFLSLLDNLGAWALWVPTAFAPAVHSHDGLGGEVMGIGTSDARPAVVRGYIHSEIDVPQIVMLDADGDPLAIAAMQGLPLALEEQAGDPDTAANQIKIYAKNTGLFFRLHSNGTVVPIAGAPAGYIHGLIPTPATSTTMGFSGGELDVDGILYRLSTAITDLDCSGLSADTWHYVYVTAPASGLALSVSDFSVSGTAPAWSDALAYWIYDGKRCVFSFKTDGSGYLRGFLCNGQRMSFSSPIAMLSTGSPASSDTSLAVGLPALGALAWFGMADQSQSNAQEYRTYMTPEAATGGNEDLICDTINSPGDFAFPLQMDSDTNGNVTYRASWGGNGSLRIYLKGFSLPPGMAR